MTEYERAIVDAGIPHSDRPLSDGRSSGGGYDDCALLFRGDGSGPKRSDFVERYSWAIPGEAALAAIAEHAPILEVGAGSGYWAYELAKRGVDVVATDPLPAPTRRGPESAYTFTKAWHPVQHMDGLAALQAYPGRALLTVWPEQARLWPSEVLAAFAGDVVLYVGSPRFTGELLFHLMLWDRFDQVRHVGIPRWLGYWDRLTVHRRRPPRGGVR